MASRGPSSQILALRLAFEPAPHTRQDTLLRWGTFVLRALPQGLYRIRWDAGRLDSSLGPEGETYAAPNHPYGIGLVHHAPPLVLHGKLDRGEPLICAAMRDFRGKSKIDNHSSFQIATLDESGSTNIWTVAELQTGSLAGSETDFGLNIGSRVKLIKTKTISKSETLRTCSAVDLECHPQDASELLVALSNGVVSRWRRFGSQPTPSNYVTLDEGSYATSFDEKSSDWALHWELIDRETTNTKMKSRISGRSPSRKSTTIGVEIMSPSPSPFYAQKDACTCISVSPFVPDYFLVAYQSGHVNLFATLQGTPIKTWAPFGGESISKIRWSNFRPAVFYALDISGVLHCFDLTTSEQYPITAAQLDGSVFDLSCNSSSYTHKSSRAKSVLAHSDCQTANITVCRFNQHFTSCMENELRE
eukprot:1375936-Amorphochlora_amoeboformis.AAC.1